MKPTVGRIVHFYDKGAFAGNGDGPYAAIVTKVYEDNVVCVTAFTPQGYSEIDDVPMDANDGRRWWSWPPRDDNGR